jgi:peroxiredoxin
MEMNGKATLGSAAPEFTLVDMDMRQRSLAEFRGKKTVLAFYPGAFTSVCKMEMCTFRDSLSNLEALDAQVIGISVNDPFSNKAFHEMNMLNFPLLCDYTRKAVNAYGVALPDFAGLTGYTVAQRSVFVLDREGTITYKWIADNPGIEPDYREVEAKLGELE